MKRRLKEAAGFTLVELIVVIAILGILAGVAVPTYSGYVKKANLAADQTLLDSINMAFASACIEEQVDINTAHSSNTALAIGDDGVLNMTNSKFVNNDDVKDAFSRYLGGEVKFKELETEDIVFQNGMFMIKDETLRMTAEQLRNDLTNSNFDDATALGGVTIAIDQAGKYFSGNDPMFSDGFSLDKLVEGSPAEEAFGFGKFDLTDEQILEMYVDGYAGWSQQEKDAYKANLSTQQMNTIRGNAYVMHMASDADGRNAATVLSDVSNFMAVLNTGKTQQEVIAYYKQINGIDENTNVPYETARDELQLGGGLISAETIVAMATSGVQNTSGISTLGSMYALAAGYYNSTYYTGAEIAPEKFANFADIVPIMQTPGFQTYLTTIEQGQTTTQAEKDIGAYLSAMTYLSQSELDLSKDSLFSGDGLALLLGALNSSN